MSAGIANMVMWSVDTGHQNIISVLFAAIYIWKPPMLLYVALLGLSLADTTPVKPPLGIKLVDATLTNPVTGKTESLLTAAGEKPKAVVLFFFDTSCPVCQNYLVGVEKLAQSNAAAGLKLVGINSRVSDSSKHILQHAKDLKLSFPVLRDDQGKLATKLGVDRVPCALVLDEGFAVRYRGRVDDQHTPGISRAKPTTYELKEAVEAVLAKEEVKTPWTATSGCLLAFDYEEKKSKGTITWSNRISAIMQARCQECHRPEEAGPFSLLKHEDALGWAPMIREVVDNGRMPPWHADAPRGHFSNDRRLTDDEKKDLLAWLDDNCPKGNPAEEPAPRKFVEGWRIGEPDQILTMNTEVKVPAQFAYGLMGMPYQYVPAGEPFKEDTWVTAVEAKPDERAQIHHIIVYMVPPGQRFPMGQRGSGDSFGGPMLTAYVPGDEPVVYPSTMAKKIPKGTQLLFQMHYTPNGRAVLDRSMVGIKTTKTPPKHEVRTRAIPNQRLKIPAGDANHEVRSGSQFTKDAVILSFSPHMHLRGKDFEFFKRDASGKTESVARVPKYDFNWQESYHLKNPMRSPAGTRIECLAHFDNSKNNPFNPDPSKEVRWGDMTWEEMMIGFLDYYYEVSP